MWNSLLTIVKELHYLEPFLEFMEIPQEIKNNTTVPMDSEIQSISFENVTFRYPKSEVDVLKNIDFTIHKGEKIALVGLNGSGKTTIIKLICRFYQPTSGCIKINDIDINCYSHKDLTNVLAAVFQDFKLLAYSIEENITCKSKLEKSSNVMETTKINALKDGIDTPIGKSYDSKATELSGGEMQKLAIARALYKNASCIILDEPTSALDPLAEAEIYEDFNKLIGEKTAIYISHRMSSSVFCDKILVIDNGEVSDFDTHNSLMKKTDKLYYKLFSAQSAHYKVV